MRVLAAVLWFVVAGGAAWAAAPADTDKRRLKADPVTRYVRFWRAQFMRILLWLVGWPHLLDAFFGARTVRVGTTPSDVVWQGGSARMVRYRRGTTAPARFSEPVLVVHSTVSMPWILDLTPTRSFVKSLLDEGFDVFLLDWGRPGAKQAHLGLAGHAAAMRAAEAAVLRLTGATRLHRVSYCFAASLSVWDLVNWPAPHVASNVLIAPAVDFDVGGGFRAVMGSPFLRPVLLLDSGACVPAAAIRESFHGLRPLALKTVGGRWKGRRALDAEYKEFYAAMAKWAWTHRRMPGALLFDVVDLYRTNPLVDGLGAVAAAGSAPPMLAVVAERDHIVPSASSLALQRVPGLRLDTLVTPAGHVSMIVGSAARATVWPGISTWLAQRQPRGRAG